VTHFINDPGLHFSPSLLIDILFKGKKCLKIKNKDKDKDKKINRKNPSINP